MWIVTLLLCITCIFWPTLASAQRASSPGEIAGTIVHFCARGGHIEAVGKSYLLVSPLGVSGTLTVNEPGLAALRLAIADEFLKLPLAVRTKVLGCELPLVRQERLQDMSIQSSDIGNIINSDADRKLSLLSQLVNGSMAVATVGSTSVHALGQPGHAKGGAGSPPASRASSPGKAPVHAFGPQEAERGGQHPASPAHYETKSVGPLEIILASRAFAGPGQYPPASFAAYGIVAFPSLPTDADKARYTMICNAYAAVLTFYGSVPAPIERQMVTVWPIQSDAEAQQINAMPRGDKLCERAVQDYNMSTALEAIDAAWRSHSRLMGRGPFLLAWSPSTAMSRSDALVLVFNLSDVTTEQQAKEMFMQWRREIVEHPELWKKGWNIDKVRVDIQLWADKYGTEVLKMFGISEG